MEGFRSYMQQRLLPAVVTECDAAVDAGDASTRAALVWQRLASCTTTQLEGHLQNYYDRLLVVRWGVRQGPASGGMRST